MPSAPIDGVPIRLQVSTASAPAVPPIDVNTGLPPAEWRANAVSYQVGIFDANGNSVDLSNVAYLQLTIAATQNAPANFIVATVLAGAITPTISRSAWLGGTAQNASFNLTAAQTDITLAAAASQDYWLQLSGVTLTGSLIVYGAGNVTFYNSGSVTPAPIAGVTSFHAQTNTSGNSTIDPSSQIHTEQITVAGGANSTRDFVLEAGNNYAGALIHIPLILPPTPNITINVLNLSLSGATIASSVTDGYIRSALIIAGFDGTNYSPLFVVNPAY